MTLAQRCRVLYVEMREEGFDQAIAVELTKAAIIAEAINAHSRRSEQAAVKTCEECKGKGNVETGIGVFPCQDCNGSGSVREQLRRV
jgi:DnaJ-class molecular chaperone